MFEALKSKAKAAKPAEPKLSLIPGAKPVTSAEFKMFQEALKESPAGSWAPRHHSVANNGSKFFLTQGKGVKSI
jgi:hypothetical protein